MKYNELTDKEKWVIIDRQTERPGSGRFNNFDKKGVYICKWCNAALFLSEYKFAAGCGWPSFDDEVDSA
ncbi:MAG: peptide-methionine (R)-S-oxide reductase, partial [Epsilonproteobacteria bacterium]|nr:peptide-methionine (R)-S-oxide reductase [Campylobacterota bacterium]